MIILPRLLGPMILRTISSLKILSFVPEEQLNLASKSVLEIMLRHIKAVSKDVMTDVMMTGRVLLSLEIKETLGQLPNLANKDNKVHLANLTSRDSLVSLETGVEMTSLVNLYPNPRVEKTS
jgi:hypothetical protein